VLEQGAFTAIAAERHQEIIALNVAGLTAMLSAFLPGMVRRGRGRVLNVASIAAFQPVPTLASYAATKAYVLSLTEALAEELRGSGVSIGALCPGFTATAMLDRAAARNGRLGQLPDLVVGRVEDVAARAYRACFNDEVVTVPGVLNQTAALASRTAPKWLLRRLTGVLGRRVL
jgi:short-subunit dehydrogenase